LKEFVLSMASSLALLLARIQHIYHINRCILERRTSGSQTVITFPHAGFY